MFVTKNRKNRTWFVGHRNPKSVSVFYSVPFKNQKKASRLTIDVDGNRLDLNGRQISVLKRILEKGNFAKTWNIK
jgi:hypothetical protein